MPKSKHRRKSSGSAKADTTSASAEASVSEKSAETSKPREKVSPAEFFGQVRDEGRKITWTTKNETMISTIMVLIMVVIMSIFFFAVDEVLRRVIPLILNFTA